ncbi:MAG: helix-turn-helix domain-containing protein [Candidatus Edwardsbacteria bacterium]|jgi:transcriptional regulator with XRE-family HTH domain|nr:helix-turn-helix domain-containing protein [Candidatus Edwardsbacteria bacterium]
MKTFRKYLTKELKNKAFARALNEERELRDLALKIAESREKMGWSQVKLASRAKITQQQLSRVETGSNFTMTTFLRVCDALGMRIDLNPPSRKTCPSAR